MPTPIRSQCQVHRRDSRLASTYLRAAGCLVAALLLIGDAHLASAGDNVWTSTGPLNVVVNALAVDSDAPGTVYAATAGKGVFKSVDAGASWQASNSDLENTYVESVVVAPLRPSTVYAVSPNRGVFNSADGGHTWTVMNEGLPDRSAHLLAIDPHDATLYLSTNDGVFKRPAGGSWMPTGLRTTNDEIGTGELSFDGWIDCLAVEPYSATVYACLFSWQSRPGPSWQLLKSADGGATWDAVAIPTDGGPIAIAIDAWKPPRVYVATYEPSAATFRVLRTADGGETWDRVGGDLPGCETNCRIHGLAFGAPTPWTLYAATDNGVYTKVEGSMSWEPLNTGMAGRMVTSISGEAGGRAVAYAGTADGVFSIHQTDNCGGDCDGDGAVRVNELVSMVDIALGRMAMEGCGAGDVDKDGHLVVNDIIAAVDRAMLGCR